MSKKNKENSKTTLNADKRTVLLDGLILGAGEGNVYSHVCFHSMGPFHYAVLCPEPSRCRWQLCRVLFRRRIAKNKSDHKGRLYFWCGRRESNPRLQLGKLTCYHYTTPARCAFYIKQKQMSRTKPKI